MKKIGYLAALAMVLMAASAMALTPTPNGVYAPTGGSPEFQRMWNDFPQASVTFTNNYPSLVSYAFNCPFAGSGWGEKSVWELSGDNGANKLLFPNFCNYSYESDFVLDGTNINHAEGGIEVSPWWNDDGGEFMVNGSAGNGQIRIWGGKMPEFDFDTAFGLTYVFGAPIHEKVRYIAGPSEPTEANPAQSQYWIVYQGLPYASPVMIFGAANPADPAPYNVGWGQLGNTKLGGQLLCGPELTVNGGAGTTTAVWTNINFQNLDAEATPAHTSTWGAMKAMYR